MDSATLMWIDYVISSLRKKTEEEREEIFRKVGTHFCLICGEDMTIHEKAPWKCLAEILAKKGA